MYQIMRGACPSHGMLQNLYKRNAFIVLGLPLLLGAVIIQFLRNEKLKVLNNI